MKKNYVISYKNLPSRLPIVTTAVIYLLVDKFKPNDLLTGVIITLMVIWWVLVLIVKFWLEESVELPELKSK